MQQTTLKIQPCRNLGYRQTLTVYKVKTFRLFLSSPEGLMTPTVAPNSSSSQRSLLPAAKMRAPSYSSQQQQQADGSGSHPSNNEHGLVDGLS
eukprot:1161409-Pelagomonas_calceolata.AAC.5